MSNVIKRPEKVLAIELFATQPQLTIAEVAEKVGCSHLAVTKWREDINFIEAIYDRYMVQFGGELPAVLSAMVREAKSGNVQAGRLVLEHSGKLVKNVNVTIDSPFEKWLKKVDSAEVVEGEIVDEEVTPLVSEMPMQEVELPPRVVENPAVRAKKEKESLTRTIKDEAKRQRYNQKQKELYQWKKRAKAVGVEPLGAKRPTKGQRVAWQEEIVRRENEKKDS